MNQANTEAGNKTDMNAPNEANTGDSNRRDVIMRPDFKNKIVGRINREVDTKNSYRLDLLISKNNLTKNFLFHNLDNVLANLFGDLSSILMDFYFFLPFWSLFPIFLHLMA